VVLVGITACFLQVRPYCRGVKAEQFGYFGGGPAVDGEGEDLALTRWQCPQHADDVLFLQPRLGFLRAGQQGGRLGDLAGGLLVVVHGVPDERPVGDRPGVAPGRLDLGPPPVGGDHRVLCDVGGQVRGRPWYMR
jgi:hypothetical protein